MPLFCFLAAGGFECLEPRLQQTGIEAGSLHHMYISLSTSLECVGAPLVGIRHTYMDAQTVVCCGDGGVDSLCG